MPNEIRRFSGDREFRQIATIPLEVVERIKAKYGEEIMDPKNGDDLKGYCVLTWSLSIV